MGLQVRYQYEKRVGVIVGVPMWLPTCATICLLFENVPFTSSVNTHLT
jgi:hypothetical protein